MKQNNQFTEKETDNTSMNYTFDKQPRSLIHEIQNCEISYSNCFSEMNEGKDTIRFIDKKLLDMYDSNFTYIMKSMNFDNLYKVIQKEIEWKQKQNSNFCKIVMETLPITKQLEEHVGKYEITKIGKYIYTQKEPPKWTIRNDCAILELDNTSMVEDLFKIDMICDGKFLGEDFCRQRAERHADICLSELPLVSYVCYYNGEPVGKCDLYFNDGTAKVEDFSVLPAYQRQGIGTTILNVIVTKAFTKGAKCIYLSTDEEDTAKEMYQKLGFQKVMEEYALFWNNL